MTAAGRVRIERRSAICTGCRTATYPLDARVGLGGFLSPQATRLACTAAASRSFDIASARLEEFAGVATDDETIRRHCHRAAGDLARRREVAPPKAAFAAEGDVEFLTDGVMTPTRSGWREAKITMFQLRPRGEPAEPEAWASRELPGPTASVAYAATADCGTLAARWGPWAEALGIDPDGELTVLGDGAAWIWGAAAVQFQGATRLLDIFHAGQHIAAAAKAVHGEGTAAAADWLEKGPRCLLADGWAGLCDHLAASLSGDLTASGRMGVDEIVSYFAGQMERLGYYARLRAGRSIGCGAVEGLARRLKVPGRGWCVGNVDGMAALVTSIDTPEWEGLWARPAA